MSDLCLMSLDGFGGHCLISQGCDSTLMGTEGFVKRAMCVHLESSPA